MKQPFIKNPDLTARKAGSLLKAELKRRNLTVHKVVTRTVSFAGFGFGSSIFADIYGWTPNPVFGELKDFGAKNGFHVDIASHSDGSPVFSSGGS